jgi:hypothetical protein
MQFIVDSRARFSRALVHVGKDDVYQFQTPPSHVIVAGAGVLHLLRSWQRPTSRLAMHLENYDAHFIDRRIFHVAFDESTAFKEASYDVFRRYDKTSPLPAIVDSLNNGLKLEPTRSL